MLASITPLGERSRGFSWRVTATWFAIAALAAGAAFGAALGAVGSLLPGVGRWRVAVLVAVLAVAVALDATWSRRRRVPSIRRQVNEDWLGRYRGWVYGVGFGAQLGVGVATIVTSAATYATVALELLSASAGAGAAIGGTFGAVRALSLLFGSRVRDRDGLLSLHRRLLALEASVRGGSTLLALAALLATIGWAA